MTIQLPHPSNNLQMLTMLLLLTMFASGVARSQTSDFPSRPVTIIVSTGAGGANDLEARMYAERLPRTMKQQVLVDYKPGAGTTIASAYVARAIPNGYTILGVSSGHMVSAATYASLPYDPIRDFAPISLLSKRSTVIVINPSVPFRTVAQYIAYSRAQPGAVTIATVGAGGSPHLNGEWFQSLVGTQATFVHYKSAGGLLPDLVAGRVQMSFGSVLSYLTQIRTGKLAALAIGNTVRSPLLPGVLTAEEQGVKGYDYAATFGVAAPRGTAPEIVNKLYVLFSDIAKDPEVAKKLEADGGFVVGSTPQQYAEFMAAEIERNRRIVKSAGVELIN